MTTAVPSPTVAPVLPARTVPRLPLWPLTAALAGAPVWWAAGVWTLGWPLLGVLLAALLIMRGRVPVPPGTLAWAGMCCWVAITAVQLDRAASAGPFMLRLGCYATAGVACVYAYCAVLERGSARRLLGALVGFWLVLVACGWLAVAVPGAGAASLIERLVPAVDARPYLFDLTHLVTTEAATGRPSAPFAYTNTWGSCWAILLPCVLAWLAVTPRTLRWRYRRRFVIFSLVASLPPAFLTLNRAMFASAAVALVVVAVRALLHGRPRLLAGVAGLGVAVLALAQVIPVAGLIEQRTATTHSTGDRLALYEQVLTRIVDSPLLGYGAPESVDTVSASAPVGTQGQLWMVLYSHGIPALVLFLAWFVIVLVRGRAATGPAGLWLWGAVAAAVVQLPFYGMSSQNLALVAIAAGVLLALSQSRRRR